MKSSTIAKVSSSVWVLAGLMINGVPGKSGVSLAAEDTWTYKAEMPTARGFVSGSVIDGRIYVIGGFPTHYSVTQANELYDPSTDTWTSMAGMPEGRTGHATCACNGKIYVFGGVHPDPYAAAKKNVYVYDPQTDTWSQKADMPYANAFCGIAVVNDTIYLIGRAPKFFSRPISTVMAYDPVSDSWTRKADMPHARAYMPACALDGKIYVFGGSDENISTRTFNFVAVYDPANDTWSSKSNMPNNRGAMGTCAMNGQIYAVGGVTDRLVVITLNQIYDPVTDAWTTKAPLQEKRIYYFLGSVGNKIYAIGGSHPDDRNPSVPVVLNSVEEYDTGLVRSPDLNGDWQVTLDDLILLIEHWGQDDPLCDIAPPPFGDGIVDVQDLEVLMSYWGQELDDPTLIARWKFDEADGLVAADSAGTCTATVCGNPQWRPEGGAVDGALALDGSDDFLVADFVLDPSEGPFSILAWIKGGAPGQVVISQIGGANWLAAGVPGGTLPTTLSKPVGRKPAPPLLSECVVTDGAWHRVGFVWDGAYRSLYVDGVEVARDTDAQAALEPGNGGLYIGVDENLEAGTFFSGLIDDLRIFDVALSPEELETLAR